MLTDDPGTLEKKDSVCDDCESENVSPLSSVKEIDSSVLADTPARLICISMTSLAS